MVFVLLGATAAGIGGWLRINSKIIQRVGGLLIIIFGLEFAGILKIPFLEKDHKFKYLVVKNWVIQGLCWWGWYLGYLGLLVLAWCWEVF